ncbi:hypothetical protein [Myxococcus xanthus]|nr:hypothetical protein [Myxococcus xanthus]
MLTCRVGMLSQELALSSATVRQAGEGHIKVQAGQARLTPGAS